MKTSISISTILCAVCLAPLQQSNADTVIVGTRKYQRTEQFLGSGDGYGNAQANLALLANGNFIASWDQGTPTSSYGQIFDQQGNTVGSTFSLNPDEGSGWKYGPVVAALPNGGFAASWGYQSASADGQIFNSSSVATGGQFTLNLNAWPVIDSFSNGDFLVAGLDANPNDTPVYARRFNASGVPYGNRFQVNTVTNGQGTASVTYGTDGRFAVAWLSQVTGYNIMARAYQSNEFSAFGPEFRVNSSSPSSIRRSYPSARYNASNELIIAWVGLGTTSSNGVFARRYDPNLLPEGTEWQVNESASSGDYPSLAIGPSNQLFFCWGSTNDMYARLLNSNGSPIGQEFRITQYTASGSRYLGWNGGLHNNLMLTNGSLALGWAGTGANGNGVYVTFMQFLEDAAITITSQPANQTVPVGSASVFSVIAISGEPLGYRWQLNGTNLPADSRISGVNSASLSISNVQSSDAGDYRVIITNSLVTVTSTVAVLSIAVPPTFSREPSNAVVSFGTQTTYSVNVSGTQPVAYQWRFNGIPIDNAFGSTFTLPSTALTNIGYYDVVVSNIAGTNVSTVATLSFLNMRLLPSLILYGPVGANYNIQSTSTLGGSSNWTTVTNINLPVTQPLIYVDPSSLTNTQQFYRAVPQ